MPKCFNSLELSESVSQKDKPPTAVDSRSRDLEPGPQPQHQSDSDFKPEPDLLGFQLSACVGNACLQTICFVVSLVSQTATWFWHLNVCGKRIFQAALLAITQAFCGKCEWALPQFSGGYHKIFTLYAWLMCGGTFRQLSVCQLVPPSNKPIFSRV